jgi:hypothetical protein
VAPGWLTEWVAGVSVVLLLALGLVPTFVVRWSEYSAPSVTARPIYLAPSAGLAAP